MTVIVARGTDNFRVALTLCDTDPDCRSGQSIVADTVDGKPLTCDGAFKLILTEDKTPGRWVRNLDSLTVKKPGQYVALAVRATNYKRPAARARCCPPAPSQCPASQASPATAV